MPSHLRNQALFEPFTAETTHSHYFSSPPQKKQKMSLTQTYYIASSARSKLGREAGKPDHNLRFLVGHANLLDSLMIELADAERDQEAWFNQTVNKAAKADEPRHIQWVDTMIREEEEEEEDEEDSSSDSEYDDSEYEMIAPLRRIPSPPVHITTVEYNEDTDSDEDYEDEEDDEEHALERVPSAQAMPELVHDDVSDDESPPSSPPALTMEFSEKERAALTTTSFYDKPAAIPVSGQDAFAKDGFFIPQRGAPMIATY